MTSRWTYPISQEQVFQAYCLAGSWHPHDCKEPWSHTELERGNFWLVDKPETRFPPCIQESSFVEKEGWGKCEERQMHKQSANVNFRNNGHVALCYQQTRADGFTFLGNFWRAKGCVTFPTFQRTVSPGPLITL